MGVFTSKKKETQLDGEEVCFDHFQVLRAIGRGSFGKVCIVQKRSNGQMYAMKYMNKFQCEAKMALHNVFKEIEILASVTHPFLVNLWYSFQDAEDMFMVVQLLLGGDLRYHLQQGVTFCDLSVRLYVLEVASALSYLHSRGIVHRDIKPDNLLLDEEGHVHLTDFNIATALRSGQLSTSMSGTKPYMAPEIYACAADESLGYDCRVDYWSLGVTMYEVRRGKRPYDIHSSTLHVDIKEMFSHPPRFPLDVNSGLVELMSGLLEVDPNRRIKSLEEIRSIPYLGIVNMEEVLSMKHQPVFIPPKGHLNCDPTFELEEMIIESKPLHKKKKRLSKQKSLTQSSQSNAEAEEERYGGMLVFNREVEERKRERERREKERAERERNWQEELETSMRESDPTGQGSTFTGVLSPMRQEEVTEKDRNLRSSLTYEEESIVNRSIVSSTNVKIRIAGSPKVKVKGTKVTIESPKSSSSSITKTNTQLLQERLKEIQTKTQTDDVTLSDDITLSDSQSAGDLVELSANQGAGIDRPQEEDEQDVCLPLASTTIATATTTTASLSNSNSSDSNSNKKEKNR